MFPFNQSYRPRQPSPDLPIIPASPRPSTKRSRRKIRQSPYARPAFRTPSSPSEVEFEHVLCEPSIYSPTEAKIECASPLELTRQETPQGREPQPLQWGDLVMVDYAEKKKVYKWPAIIVPPGHMTDNLLDYPPEDDETAIGVRWIEPSPSYSWVPAQSASRLTPEMVEQVLATITGPKKLVQAWELARNPPSPFDYLLEKKLPYFKLVEKVKTL